MKKNIIKIFYLTKLLYISFIFILISKSKSDITIEEFENFFESMTLDRIRQIYWNIVIDVNSKISSSNLGQTLQKSYIEDTLHSLTRNDIIVNLMESLRTLNSNIFSYYKDINLFENKLNDIELFTSLQDIISDDMPKNFLINFAINIDRYERTKEKKIDGISDYINYLSREKIIEYILDKIDYYDEIKDNFREIILNNKTLYYNELKNYYEDKTIEELIQLIYGFENFLFNNNSVSEVRGYENYDHENIDKIERLTLYGIVVLYSKEAFITTIDESMTKIENKNFQYINNEEIFNEMKSTEFQSKILALEKYYKKQMNYTKSLRGLNEYIKNMKEEYRRKILKWGFDLYPELYESGRFQDIISNEINYQYGQVKEFVQVTERSTLLRYAYNIHTFQNEIKSIYNDELYNIYRYKNEKLYELILSDTNLNRNLQLKTTFINFADLHKDFFCKYLENLQRNQLKKIIKVLLNLYFKEKEYEIDSYQRPSEFLIRLEYMMNSDNDDLLYEAENYVNTTSFEIQSTSNFFQLNKDLIKEYINDYFGYYNNTIDFLRSTNIIYLNRWLRKYEKIIRKKKLYNNIEGGIQNRIFKDEEITKKEILEIFDIYIEEYPELFEPKEFIKIVGLNNDKTPHKKLVELFYNISDSNNKDIIMRIAYSLTGHFQRKNIQASFDVFNFISELENILYNNYDSNININTYSKYLYQFFRIINIFPELVNYKIFEIICINNDTRVISLYEDNDLKEYFKRDLVKLAKNIQYYLNKTNNYDKKNIDAMNEEELKKYLLDFSEDQLFTDDYDLKSRILDGDFYPIIYDYYEHYLNTIDEEHLNFIYKNIKLKCSENYPCQNFSDSTNINDKKQEIINNIKNVQEFQEPTFFDKYFDYISGKNDDELYQMLVNCTNKELKFYAIIANIIKIETMEKNENIKVDNLPEDIYFKIHYMSRNSMIRYILQIKEINSEMINGDILPLLIKYYMLDIGSENIYDLTLY